MPAGVPSIHSRIVDGADSTNPSVERVTTSQLGEKVEIEAKRVVFFKKNRTVFKTRRTAI
jgi:hypothetical protein